MQSNKARQWTRKHSFLNILLQFLISHTLLHLPLWFLILDTLTTFSHGQLSQTSCGNQSQHHKWLNTHSVVQYSDFVTKICFIDFQRMVGLNTHQHFLQISNNLIVIFLICTQKFIEGNVDLLFLAKQVQETTIKCFIEGSYIYVQDSLNMGFKLIPFTCFQILLQVQYSQEKRRFSQTSFRYLKYT